nr:PREDICTED: uncharacterized protein LOC109044802 [Bemisia tabaci]
MVVPFDTFMSDEQIAEDYRRFDKLIGDLCDVLFHVLTSGRASSPGRPNESNNGPNLHARTVTRRSRRMSMDDRQSDRTGLNEMCPDLISNIYRHPKRNSQRVSLQISRR